MNQPAFALIFNSTLSNLSHVLLPALYRVKITIFLNRVFFLVFPLLLVFSFTHKLLKHTKECFIYLLVTWAPFYFLVQVL